MLVPVCVLGSDSLRKDLPNTFFAWHESAVFIAALTGFGVASVGPIFFPVDVVKSKPTVPRRRGISISVASPAKAGVTKIIDFWPVERGSVSGKTSPRIPPKFRVERRWRGQIASPPGRNLLS